MNHNEVILNNMDNDPFKTETNNQEIIHVRLQQRNGKKTLTTIQGLSKDLEFKKLLKAFKKEFACNGCIIDHKEFGEVIQLQGDQRENIKKFLINSDLSDEEHIKLHGA